MRRVCAWCKDELDRRDDGKNIVTHGICESCVYSFLEIHPVSLQQYLDDFSVPILVLNEDRRIIGANHRASKLANKKISGILGKLGGEVMECEHAYSKEGCGHNIHCKACTIRKTVLSTFETGESHDHVPAYLNVRNPDGTFDAQLVISTEKVGDSVFLRIDECKTNGHKMNGRSAAHCSSA